MRETEWWFGRGLFKKVGGGGVQGGNGEWCFMEILEGGISHQAGGV